MTFFSISGLLITIVSDFLDGDNIDPAWKGDCVHSGTTEKSVNDVNSWDRVDFVRFSKGQRRRLYHDGCRPMMLSAHGEPSTLWWGWFSHGYVARS